MTKRLPNSSSMGIAMGLCLVLFIHGAWAQVSVSGQVTDNEGASLPGVNVLVKGGSQGAVTDAGGEYSIQVPSSSSVLVFSFIGFTTREVAVGNRAVIDITLEPEITALEEVVVLGYQTTQERRDLTGAASTITPEDFARVPATSPLEAFQARAPGLRISNSSGLPGSGAEVRVRGIQSNSTNDEANRPIYVVDGIITDNIESITPQDIEYVSILKDASEAAIYGSRAANGVIIVQTKRGKRAGQPQIGFSSMVGFQGKSDREIEVLNAPDWLNIWTEAYVNGNVPITWNAADLAQYDGVDTDWLGVMRQTGVLQNYNLSVSGSSEGSNYYLSAGHLNHKGVVVGTNYDKYTLRLNSDHTIGKHFRFGNSLNINVSEENGNGGEYALAARKVPLTRVYEDDGTWGKIRNTTLEHQHQNPLWRAQNVIDQRQFKDLLGSLYLTITPLEGLNLTARGNVEWNNRYDTDFSPGVDPLFQWEGSTRNVVTKRETQNLHWTTDFLADYQKSFAEKHLVKALFGYSREENTNEWLEGSGSGTPNNSIQYIHAADPDPTTRTLDNRITDWSFVSMFGRLNYTFLDKYLLTATVRRDGSSRLAEGNRFHTFPSVSVGWRLSEESFMSGASFVTDMKLRASVGKVGSVTALGTYPVTAALSTRDYVLNQTPSQGYSLTSAINSNIVWESTTKKDIGLDASFLNDRIYTSLDYFVENTTDLLFDYRLPPSTGLTNEPTINAGDVKNSGFEATVGVRKNVGDWFYDVNVNLTHVKNEVLDIGDRDLASQGTVLGYPLRSFYGYRSSGLVRSQGDLDQPQLTSAQKDIGDVWLLDINGQDADGKVIYGQPDGIVNSADRTIIGKKYPDLYYGLVGSVGYKHLTLQIQLQGVQGIDKDILGGGQGVYHYYTAWAMNSSTLVLDRYSATENPNGEMPRVVVGDPGKNREFSDFWLDDASYLRIKNVNLSYDLSSLVQGINMKRLNIYFSIDNLHTFTKFKGADVDSTSGDRIGSDDDANTTVPIPRTFTMGLNATF